MIETGASRRPDLPIAVVIGGGGMGMATARRLGQSFRLVLASASAAANADRERALAQDGIDAICFQCDITQRDSVAALAAFVDRCGPLRALAHVAAKSPSTADWHEILALNLIGAALVEQALFPLVRQGTAAVFVSSLAAHLAPPLAPEIWSILDDPLSEGALERLEAAVPEASPNAGYTLSKAALNRMCARRAIAWGRRGGRIVSMSPGAIATPMGARELAGSNRAMKLELIDRSPIRREGTMVETADAIEFLLSDRASFITGTDLLVDGGTLAALRWKESD